MLYLLHADTPLRTMAGRETRHYLGYSGEDDLWRRLRKHQLNQSHVAIVAAWHNVGAQLTLVKLWPHGSRQHERQLKNAGHVKNLCPICFPPMGGTSRLPLIAIPTSIPLSSVVRSLGQRKSVVGITLDGTPLVNSGSYRPLPILGGRIASGVDGDAPAHSRSTSS